MYFLSEQVNEYDRKSAGHGTAQQLELFVKDENSAVEWLRNQIKARPQTFQELHSVFLRETNGWDKHERRLDLLELLEQNFIRYDGVDALPSQIHGYLSSNFKDMRSLSKDDPSLKAKGKDRWYVPDPRHADDLRKLREKALLRVFDDYRISSERRLKVLRVEAIRAGFRRAWQNADYATILTVSEKVPDDVLQEDPMLLMWYTNSLTRSGRQS